MTPPPRPLVLIGDLNMGPRRARRITGMEPLATGATFPSTAPLVQIDHVLSTGGVVPLAARVVELPVSDHRALVVDL